MRARVHYMQKLFGFIVAAGLVISPLAWADPLAAGKPAGVHHAEMSTGSLITAAGLGIIAVTVIALAASGDDNAAQQPTATSSTATST
jgi:branched-subunit amino acid permease